MFIASQLCGHEIHYMLELWGCTSQEKKNERINEVRNSPSLVLLSGSQEHLGFAICSQEAANNKRHWEDALSSRTLKHQGNKTNRSWSLSKWRSLCNRPSTLWAGESARAVPQIAEPVYLSRSTLLSFDSREDAPVFLWYPSGLHLWVEKVSYRGERQPTPVFLPGKSPWTEQPGGL